MRTANILAFVAAIIWFGVALMGVGLVGGVVDQRVVGYPNVEQIEWSIVRPFCALSAILALAWVCNGLRKGAGLLGAVAVVALLALLPFLALSSGGV